MNLTPIEWTMFSSNPLKFRDAAGKVVWGCVGTSPGCAHCYSETLAKRYGRGGPFTAQVMSGLTPFLDDAELHKMRTAKQIGGVPVSGSRCFIGDMTDLFGEWVPDDLLNRLFSQVLEIRTDVTWQILTKRADRLRKYLSWRYGEGRIPSRNIHIGVSCENQHFADERIPLLLSTPAAVRFVSVEPCIGLVDLSQWLRGDEPYDKGRAVVPGASSNRRLHRGQSWSDLAPSSSDSREQDGRSAVLARHGGKTGGGIGVGRISDSDVLGRREASEGVRSSDSVDGDQPGGRSGPAGGQPQRRRAYEYLSVELGVNDAVWKRPARDPHPRAEAIQSERPEKPISETDGISGVGDPASLRNQSYGSEQGGRDVRGITAVDLRDLPPQDLEAPSLSWVIVGGESGPGARPMHPDWARSIRDQCQAAGVPFFFKQWGALDPFYDRDKDDPDWRNVPKEGPTITRMNLAGGQGFHGERVIYFRRGWKRAAGRLLDGREWNEYPEVRHAV